MTRRRQLRQGDRGAVVPTVAVCLTALCGLFAMAFNVGLIVDSRAELQNAADAAALAAARSLNGEASGLEAARNAANAYSRQHTAAGDTVLIDAFGPDLSFGRWHLDAADCVHGDEGNDCFEELDTDEPRKITAVKIGNGRDDGATRNEALELPFGSFVGKTSTQVSSAAVAVGAGSAAVECSLPMAVAECKIVKDDNSMACDGAPHRMVFSNANADAIGFINLYYPGDQQAPSGNFAADVIRNRSCNSSHFRVGEAKLQNGNDFEKVIEALRGVEVKGKTEEVTGACLIGSVQTMAVTDAGCPGNPIFQGVQEVVGFVKVTIVAVTDNQGNVLGCPGEGAPNVTGPFDKHAVIMDVSCEAAAGTGEWGGGRAYNTSDVRVRLVD